MNLFWLCPNRQMVLLLCRFWGKLRSKLAIS